MELKVDYDVCLGKMMDFVSVDCQEFHYRNDEPDLPRVGAFCKKCATETAKPVYPITMNGRPAYALKCEKCGSEYPMYKSMFIERYIGYDLAGGGHVNPTHGMKSHRSCMDRTAIDNLNDRHKRVEKMVCGNTGWSPEKYQEFKKKWAEDQRKAHIRFEREEAERSAQYADEDRLKRSNERKELIAQGILKYVKNIGLVDTRTNQVVKL